MDELRDRVVSLERMLDQEREARTEERRRHDTLMAQLMQRIPELEADSEPRESPEAAPETSDMKPPRSTSEGQQELTSQPQEEQRSWWRRVFGFG